MKPVDKGELRPPGKDHCPLDDMLKLPDISGPGIVAERAHILKVLEATAWRVSGKRGAGELLGLPPRTLRSRMQELGIVKRP